MFDMADLFDMTEAMDSVDCFLDGADGLLGGRAGMGGGALFCPTVWGISPVGLRTGRTGLASAASLVLFKVGGGSNSLSPPLAG